MTQELTVVNKQEMFAPTKEDYQNMQVGEPQNMLEVRALANFLTRSKFIPQSFRGDLNTAVMLIVTCKQYGLPITALSEVMEVNGKVGFWGRTKLGIVLKSGVCEYIIPTEQTDKKCTVETQRKGWPKPVTITYTLEQAEKAGLLARSDAWKKHPSDMLYWRAVSRVISQVYPDVIQGFATVEEMEEEPAEEAKVVAMPQEIEMPKPKRARKIKALATEEHSATAPILPTAQEMESYDATEAPVEAQGEAMFDATVVKEDKEPKRIERIIKQVYIENGERWVSCEMVSIKGEDSYKIPTAGLAGELKKLTGMKVYLFIDNGSVTGYDNAAD
jgi:hypothetical protein